MISTVLKRNPCVYRQCNFEQSQLGTYHQYTKYSSYTERSEYKYRSDPSYIHCLRIVLGSKVVAQDVFTKYSNAKERLCLIIFTKFEKNTQNWILFVGKFLERQHYYIVQSNKLHFQHPLASKFRIVLHLRLRLCIHFLNHNMLQQHIQYVNPSDKLVL